MTKRKRKYNDTGATTLSIKPPPMRPSVIESDVAVPLFWAAILAASIGLVAVLAALAVREILSATWPWWTSPAAGASVAILVFAWRCTVAEGDRRALLLWPLEAALGRDLDRDGWVGEPEATVETVEPDHRLVYVHDPHQEQRRRNAQDFRHFLKSAYDGKGTAWREWDDEPLPSGRRVTQPLWECWTGRLIQSGLATRDYPTAPLVLAGGYRQALDTLRNVL